MNDIQVWAASGTLREDAILKFTQSGYAILDFKLHSRREYATKDGMREEVLTSDCTVMGGAGKTLAPQLRAGSRLLVRGRWRLNQWKDSKTGADRWRHVVSVDEVDVLSGSPQQSIAAAQAAPPDADGPCPF